MPSYTHLGLSSIRTLTATDTVGVRTHADWKSWLSQPRTFPHAEREDYNVVISLRRDEMRAEQPSNQANPQEVCVPPFGGSGGYRSAIPAKAGTPTFPHDGA
jgi:hypothetical protein